MRVRPAAMIMAAMFLMSLFATAVTAWPYDDADEDYVPDDVEALCAQTGPITTGSGSIGDCAGGQWDWDSNGISVISLLCSDIQPQLATLEGILDGIDPFFNAGDCTGGYWEGPSNETPQGPDLGNLPDPNDGPNGVWNAIQAVIDGGFESLESQLASLNLGVTLTNQTSGGSIIDRDEDGSPDAWRILNGAATVGWVQSDFVWGNLTNGTGMIVSPQNGALVTAAGLHVHAEGAKYYIDVVKPQGTGNNTAARVTIDPTATPNLPATSNRLVTIDIFDPKPPPVQLTPVFPLFWAPAKFDHLVISSPNDIDGDGHSLFAELFTGEANGHLLSNPLNRDSVPGDADADGCPFTFEGDDDTNGNVIPCNIFPFIQRIVDIDSDPTTTAKIVWDTPTLTFRTTNVTGTLFTPAQSLITEWSAYTTNTNNANATGKEICGGVDLLVTSTPFSWTCPFDTDDWEDNFDNQAAADYHGWLKICIEPTAETGKICQWTGTPIIFDVQNLPQITYHSFKDATDGDTDDDRDGWISDNGVLNITASHPGHDMAEFTIEVRPCTRTTSNNPLGSSTACSSGTSARTFILDASDPAVSRVKPDEDWWHLTFDTKEFPVTNAPATLGAADNAWAWLGNQFIATVETEGGYSRTGQGPDAQNQLFPSSAASAHKVFNNREPQVTQVSETNGTSSSSDTTVDVLFRFHAYDPDGTTPASAKVTVDGQTVDCSRANPNALGDNSPWDADWTCRWDAGTRQGTYPWTLAVKDPDRGDNTNNTAGPLLVNLANTPPVLTAYDPEPTDAVDSPVPGDNITYTFRVHYSDTQSAPASVTARITNTTMALDRSLTMSRCLVQETDPLDALDGLELLTTGQVGNMRNGDYCVEVSLKRGANFTYQFSAVDLRGASGLLPSDILKVPDVECNTCFDDDEAEHTSQGAFMDLVAALNGIGPQPISGYTINQALEAPYDDDGDFVGGLVEAMVLETDIFTAGPSGNGPYSYVFKDEWSIELKRPTGGGTASHSALKVTVSGDEDEDVVRLSICSQPEACQVEDLDVGLVSFETTPRGFTLTVSHTTGKPAVRLVADALNAGSTTKPVVSLFIDTQNGNVTVDVMTNPVNVVYTGKGALAGFTGSLYGALQGLLPPGTNLPTAGVDKNAGGQPVAYVDPDGSGPAPRIPVTGDTSVLDTDNDGYPDASEVLVCYFLENPFDPSDGHCTDDNGDFILDNYHPA